MEIANLFGGNDENEKENMPNIAQVEEDMPNILELKKKNIGGLR